MMCSDCWKLTAHGPKPPLLPKVEEFRASVLAKREEWEAKVLPDTDFEIIYPNEDTELQERYEVRRP